MENIILVPAIEFDPFDFTQNFERLETNIFKDGDSSWLAALADSGITELKPIAPCSWCVEISQIRHKHTIEMLLKHYLQHLPEIMADRNLCELFDNTGPIVGGYFLIVNDVIVIKPGCCADLAGINEWEDALEGDSKWQSLWNGHEPSLFSRCRTEEIIEFAYAVPQLDLVKSRKMPANSLRRNNDVQMILLEQRSSMQNICAAIGLSNLTVAVRQAKQELIEFGEVVKPILNKFLPSLLVDPMLDVMLYERWPSNMQLLDLASELRDWTVEQNYTQ